MKTRILAFVASLCLFLTPLLSKAQVPDSNSTVKEWVDYIYGQLDTSSLLNTDILMDKGFLDSSFFNYRGAPGDSAGYKEAWYEMYNSARMAGLSPAPPPDSLYRWAGTYIDQGLVPMLGMHIRYDFLHPKSLDSGWVDTVNTQYVLQPGPSPFILEELVSFATTVNQFYADTAVGDTFRLIFPSELFYTNIPGLLSFDYKLGDEAWQEGSFDTELARPIKADPAFPRKDITVQVRLNYPGFTRVTFYKITIITLTGKIINLDIPYAYDAEIDINTLTTLTYDGINPVKGYAAITFGKDALGNKHTCITKPIIITDGIDFGTRENPRGCLNGKCGSLGWVDIALGNNKEYPELANGPRLVEALTEKGYDIIFLDFYDGATYMEDNAMVLVKLIQHINTWKCTNEELVVCGVSMGGQVAKFALSYMEANNMEHCVRTYVSFDSPHKGANIPIGLQQFVHYGKYQIKNRLATDTYDRKLSRPATKQLLNYHISGPNFQQALERSAFLSNLNAEGNYPNKTRNVAIMNGSATAVGQGFNPGDLTYEGHITLGIVNIDMEINALCGTAFSVGPTTYYRTCYANFLFKKAVNYLAPDPCTVAIDHSPGGLRKDLKDASESFGVAHFASQCFIPSISSLDVNTGNYFFNIASNIFPPDEPNPSLYPFEAYFASFDNSNEPHVFLSYYTPNPTDPERSNIAWLVNEIESTRVGLAPGAFSSTYNFGQVNKNRLPGLAIGSGGLIQVNGNYATGTGSGSAPLAGSTFEVYKRGCENDISIESGGSMIIGDDNTPTNNKGIVYFPEGTGLSIESGGTLQIHNGSKLVIEAGATLNFYPDAVILLDGPDAVLEIKGVLKIHNGTFSFSKSPGFVGGYIRFDVTEPGSGIMALGSSGKFILTGATNSGYSDKVLEIVGGTLRTPDVSLSAFNYLSEFSITTGTVTIGANSKLEVTIPSSFSLSIFSGLSQTNSVGLYLPDPSLATIEECSFRDLNTGLKLDLAGVSSNPVIELCSFKDNVAGIETEDGGLDLQNCLFSGNDYGWLAYALSENSEVKQSAFTGNEYGIKAEGSGTPHLYLEETHFGTNEYGLWVSDLDPIEVTAQCCLFTYNSERGIYSGDLLNLSTLKTIAGETGGNCAFYNNEVAVHVIGELYLEDGQNVFRNNGAYSLKTFLTGYMPPCTTCGFMNGSWQVYAAENYWDPGYQSSLQVSTFPVSPASFTGTPYSTFTSTCFLEGISGNPMFTFSMDAPSLKKDPDGSIPEGRINSFRLYPNPAGDKVFFEGEIVSAEVFDLNGKKQGVFVREEKEGQQVLDVSSLALGVYTVAVQTSDRLHTVKLVIIH